jgi:hypothetical protein
MKWAVILNFVAIAYWFAFVTAVMSFQSISIGAYLDIGFCIGLLVLNRYQKHWEHELQVAKFMREYL